MLPDAGRPRAALTFSFHYTRAVLKRREEMPGEDLPTPLVLGVRTVKPKE